MKHLIFGAALALASLAARAQDTIPATVASQPVDLQSYGVTTVKAQPVTATHRPAVHNRLVVATGRATPKAPVTGGAVAYYCASGNTVKYHASPGCRGLNRCSASVEKLALGRAQQEMDACKICH